MQPLSILGASRPRRRPEVERPAFLTRRPFNPLYWLLAQTGSRLRSNPRVARDLTAAEAVGRPATLSVPTRHGDVRLLVLRPTQQGAEPGTRPPVIMQLHGGGFINRHPEQDLHLARYLAAGVDAVVVLPDYDTAPRVRYPVAEEEAFDVARWLQRSGREHGWDGDRLLLSGVSAGAKLAINVCQQLHDAGEAPPLAVALTVPFTDATRTDRTSSYARAAISPFVQRAVAWAYFPDVDRRREKLAAPRHDSTLPDAMPPTLVQTGERDTLAAEGAELADTLRAAGVEAKHRSYPEADHGFYASEPTENVSNLLVEITTFFRAQLGARAAEAPRLDE